MFSISSLLPIDGPKSGFKAFVALRLYPDTPPSMIQESYGEFIFTDDLPVRSKHPGIRILSGTIHRPPDPANLVLIVLDFFS